MMTPAENDEEGDSVSSAADAAEQFDMDEHRDLMTRLDNRVPHEVPVEVASTIRSSIAAELKGAMSEPVLRRELTVGDSSFNRRRLLSLVTGGPVLIAVFLAINVFVAWQNDHRVAAVVGEKRTDAGSENVSYSATQLAFEKPGVSTLFEFNVSLIQRELNHERIKFHGTGFFVRERKTISPAEEKRSKRVPESSGAAVRPRSGIQRFSELAGWLRA